MLIEYFALDVKQQQQTGNYLHVDWKKKKTK